MKVKRKIVKDSLYPMKKAIQSIDGKKINVGVLQGEQQWLAGIHEYGCRIKVTEKMRAYLAGQGLHLKKSTTHIVIPERSFLRAGFDECQKSVTKKIEAVLPLVLCGKMPEEQLFDLVGTLLKSRIQEYARKLNQPPNHPFTIERKGSYNPLVDTEDMINSICYEVEE